MFLVERSVWLLPVRCLVCPRLGLTCVPSNSARRLNCGRYLRRVWLHFSTYSLAIKWLQSSETESLSLRAPDKRAGRIGGEQKAESREPELERELERREEIEWIVQCVCGSAGAANRPKRLFLPTSSAAVWLTGRRLCGRRPLGAKPSHWLSLSSSTLLSSSKRRVNKPDSAECHFGSRDLARCDVARRGRCLLSAVRFRVSLDELEMGDRRISAARTQTKSLDHRTASSTRLKLRVNR